MKTKGQKVLIIGGGIAATGTVLYFLFRDSSGKIGQFIRRITNSDISQKVSSLIKPISDLGTNGSGGSVGKSDVVHAKDPVSTTGAWGQCQKYVPDSFPLAKCMKGEKVRALQAYINKVSPSADLKEDGYFGDKTETALKAYSAISLIGYKTAIEGTAKFYNAADGYYSAASDIIDIKRM